MGKAKHAFSLGVHVPTAMLPLIDERAKRRGYSRSKYISLLISQWYAQGSPEPDIGAQLRLERLLKGAPLEFPKHIEIDKVATVIEHSTKKYPFNLKDESREMVAEDPPQLGAHDTDRTA